MFFCFTLDYFVTKYSKSKQPNKTKPHTNKIFVIVLFAVVVLGLVFSVLCQKIGWEECLRNELFFVVWDIKM